MPGLAPNAKPVVAALRTRLDALAMTPGSLTQQRIADFLARAQSGSASVSTYFERSVYNAGEKIGTVGDLIIGPDGKIVAAVIGVGGFLGIGEKEVAAPFSRCRSSDVTTTGIVMNVTKDSLRPLRNMKTPACAYV